MSSESPRFSVNLPRPLIWGSRIIPSPAWRTLFVGVALAVTFVGFLALVQFSPPDLVGTDDHFHVRFAALMRTEGLLLRFPWLPLTILNAREFYDHHFLFHVALIPFTFGDLITGGKWASVVFTSLAFLSVWWLLRCQKVPYADFQLIAGTNRDLFEQVKAGRFREDLLARINLWSYRLPSLRERLEDLEPNLDYELERFAQRKGALVRFNKVARETFLQFALSSEAHWRANFRDLNASITHMATLAPGGRITTEVVAEEITRLRHDWHSSSEQNSDIKGITSTFLDGGTHAQLDLIEHIQLAAIAQVCGESETLAEAGRRLFDRSREEKRSSNDSNRLRQLLAKYGLDFQQVKRAMSASDRR